MGYILIVAVVIVIISVWSYIVTKETLEGADRLAKSFKSDKWQK